MADYTSDQSAASSVFGVSSLSFGEMAPYAHSAERYFELGWGPLPVRGKGGRSKSGSTGTPPPPGFTGRDGHAPSLADVTGWVESHGDWNVALRLPDGVVGVDVDAYDGKNGGSTLAELESTRGPLPLTWVSGSRDDGTSGIRMFRVPARWLAPATFGPGIEGIGFWYRYAIAWPSTHPDTAQQYRWRRQVPGGEWQECSPPAVSDLPELPEAWLAEWHKTQQPGGISAHIASGDAVDIADMIRHGAGPSGGQRYEFLRLTQKLAGTGRTDEEIVVVCRAVADNTPQDPADPWTDLQFLEFARTGRARAEAHALIQPQLPAIPQSALTWARSPGNSIAVPSPDDSGGGGNDGTLPPGGDSEDDAELPPGSWFEVIPWLEYRLPSDYTQPQYSNVSTADHDGICKLEMRGSGNNRVQVAVPITSAPLVVSRLMQHDGEVKYELTWKSVTGEVKCVTASGADVADSRRLVRLFPEAVVTGKHAGDVSEYLQLLTEENKAGLTERRVDVTGQLGWRGDALAEFVFGDGRPCAVDDVKNTGTWLRAWEVRGALSEWREVVWLAAGQTIPLAAVAASLCAPLLRVLGAPPFVFDISSSTSTGKTVTLWLAASVWGNPVELVQSWHNTLVANEHYLSCLRGLPYFLNESQLAKRETVAELIYSLTEGHSKGRSKQDGTGLTGHVSYESVLVSCGENTLTSFTEQGGIIPRVVTVEGQPMASAVMADAVKSASAQCYGTAGEEMLRIIRSHDLAELRSRHAVLAGRLRELAPGPVAGRRSDSVAAMAVAAELAVQAGLTPEVAPDFWPFLASGGGASETGSDDKPWQALQLVANEISTSPFSFYVENHGQYSIAPGAGGWSGRWQPGQYAAVSPRWLRDFLGKYGHEYDRTVKSWRDRGWLEHTPGALTDVVRIQGRATRLVKITCSELVAMVGDLPLDSQLEM